MRFTVGLVIVLAFVFAESMGQNVAGFWLGVTYPTDPNQAVYNYTMTLTQTGTTLGGTAQTANPSVPFGGVAYLSGKVTGSTVTFSEADKNGSTMVKDICYWRGTLTYNPVDESLIGTYENITNGTTCRDMSGGKVELYRIVLKSGATYCKGSPINLSVTGKDIKWYSSAARSTLLARGNTYSPKITQTTTFYITQTLYQNESPAVPITVEVVEPTMQATTTNAGCGKTDGAVSVTATGSANWQYSLNGGAFQASSSFANLKPGSYSVVAKDAAGCQAEKSVTVASDSGPVISSLEPTPPRCETANGQIQVITTGGKAPLIYSIDGMASQTSPTFTKLPGGTYTIRVRDASGCEANRGMTLPAFKPMVILSTDAATTTCGQSNGRATMTTTGGTKPVQYSIDNQTFQMANTFGDLKSGNYTLTARDSAGCTVSQSVSVAASSGPQAADIQTTPAACGQQNGAILITPRGIAATVNYSIDGQTFQRTADFSGLAGGSYTLTMKDDKNCLLTQTVQIPLDCANRIHVPTAFSPNADQINDALTLHFAFPSITVSRFTVYDRWGSVIYNRANFVLSNGEPIWDGQNNGQAIPVGMYTYRMDCQFPDGTQTSYRESVALLN